MDPGEAMSFCNLQNRIMPSYIQFYPTLRCNDSCPFCFNRQLASRDDVTPPDFEKILSIMQREGIDEIDILGGEPTLHPELPRLIDGIIGRGLRATLSSNGSRVDDLRALSDTHPADFLKIGISLNRDLPSEDLQRYILSYKPLLKSIFPMSSTMRRSFREYMKIPGMAYFLLYRDVLDRHDLPHSTPFYRFYGEMRRVEKALSGVHSVFCSGFIPDKETYPVLESVRCPAGTTKLSLLPDGAVYPCYLFFRHKAFELGNILRDDFKKILQHPVLNFFRQYDRNRCPKSSCPLYRSCHGGCPAMAFAVYRDLASPDPRCMNRDYDFSKGGPHDENL